MTGRAVSEHELIEQIASTWRFNNQANLKLLRAISSKGLRTVPLDSKGPHVAEQSERFKPSGFLFFRACRINFQGHCKPDARSCTC